MKVENQAAFRFIFQDDVYLLDADKSLFNYIKQQPAVKSEMPEPVIQTEAISFNYLGGNNKHFLVLANYTDAEFMNDAHLAALTSTLGRKDLDIDDVAIVNLAKNNGADITRLYDFFKPARVLVLGNESLPADVSVPFNKAVSHNGAAILHTFSFADMMTSNENKKAFWEQVKVF